MPSGGLKILLAASAVVATIVIIIIVRKPRKWTKVGVVSSLVIYPLKSGRGRSVMSLTCTGTGARDGDDRDRMFAVVDEENGRFRSGRDLPELTRVEIRKIGESFLLQAPGSEGTQFELPIEGEAPTVRLRIWTSEARGLDCGNRVATWLSEQLLHRKSGLRLLYCSDGMPQKEVNQGMKEYAKLAGVAYQPKDAGLFSDTFSYHLVSEASIEDLNSKMTEAKVSAMNFRPNIVIRGEGLKAFDEDQWRRLRIGTAAFECLAPCMRCSFPRIDPDSGERLPGSEPTTTLNSYRFVSNPEIRKVIYTPTMGVYLGARREGIISVGDSVFAM